MNKAYKVVEVVDGKMLSSFVRGDLGTEYKRGIAAHAPVGELFVFSTLRSARMYMETRDVATREFEIWNCLTGEQRSVDRIPVVGVKWRHDDIISWWSDGRDLPPKDGAIGMCGSPIDTRLTPWVTLTSEVV